MEIISGRDFCPYSLLRYGAVQPPSTDISIGSYVIQIWEEE
jgi:hypothetical protein